MSLLRVAAVRAAAPLSARAASTSAVHVVSSRSNDGPALANIEASWATLPASEQLEVYQQLEQVQKQDWKQLSTDEKKAGE